MKYFLFAIIFFSSCLFANAQELIWETDVYKAVSKSNEVKKPILMFFTGSDWCGWCIRLQNEVLKKPEFVAWAKDHVVLLELDFPRRTPISENVRAQNNSLQSSFAVQGFPTIKIVNANLKEGIINFELLGTLGYMSGGPNIWITEAQEILKVNSKNTNKEVSAKE